jgi:PKD repeat protein
VVTVWANASVGSIFAGFTGNLSGLITPQTLVMNGDKAVDAEFTLESGFTLTLTTSGTGNGTIQASPAGPYTYGTIVTIWANASVGSIFAGFTGNLSGLITPQTLVMNGDKAVDAEFTLESGFTLTLTTSGTGNGTIQASPAGPYTYGTIVTIWANASVGSIFAGFTGNLSGLITPQTLVMNGDKAVDAEFTLQTGFTLTLTMSGLGSGTIEANASGPFSFGAKVRIWANASDGSMFTGFSGGLSGTTSPQDLIIQGDTSVDAEFIWDGPYLLSLSTSGTGSGTIQASPGGPYTYGTVVTVWANASGGSTFGGFSGALTGKTTPQTLVMNSNKSVTATFTISGGYQPPPSGPDNKNPVADASAGAPYQGFVGSPILFDGSKSYDPDGNITKWLWDFGDNSNGTGEVIQHIYSRAGTYTVTLIVTDNEGATGTTRTTCVISEPTNRPPTKPIISGTKYGPMNTTFIYTAFSTDPDNDLIKYTFDWGDSVVQSSEFVPNGTRVSMEHRWTMPGQYTLTVTVTDNQTVSSSQFTITITEKGETQSATPGFELVFFLCAIALSLILWKKKRVG